MKALIEIAVSLEEGGGVSDRTDWIIGFITGVRASQIVPEWAIAAIKQMEFGEAAIPELQEWAVRQLAERHPVEMVHDPA